jgi:hypothetical protein
MNATTNNGKMVGMYVHQHWPYNRPYCARTWTLEDWRGYADGLTKLGYNILLLWPMLEFIPDPPTPSDLAHIEKMRQVVEMLQTDFQMRVWFALCPNVAPIDEVAVRDPFEKRHFFYCDYRVNPGDPEAMAKLIARREKLFRPLCGVDGVSIIDSDPGGYPGSTNQEFVDILTAHRRLFDSLRPGIEIIYWMHAGWLGYNRFYETAVLTFSTDEENTDCLTRLAQANPEPWGVANGLPLMEKLGMAHRVISFNYGRIEGEPSFPLTNFGGNNAWEGGNAPGPRGVMGNAQTHCVQLPNTFAFARGAQGLPVTEADYIAFAEELIPGLGAQIVAGWSALVGADVSAMHQSADTLDAIPESAIQPGRLQGLLFGSPRRFLSDLSQMLRMRAAYVALRDAEGTPTKEQVRAFAETASAWQQQHGYENSWWWPDLDATLRKIGSPDVNAVLDTVFNPFAPPPPGTPGTPYEIVAEALRFAESFTPRLLTALNRAAQ